MTLHIVTPLVIGAFAAGVAVDRFGIPAVLKAIVTLWKDAVAEVESVTAAKKKVAAPAAPEVPAAK